MSVTQYNHVGSVPVAPEKVAEQVSVKEITPQTYDHVITLPRTPIVKESINVRQIAQSWLDKFSKCLDNNDFSNVGDFFHEQSYWRDFVALQWDLRNIHGSEKISSFLQTHQPKAQLSQIRLQDKGKYVPTLEMPRDDLQWISSMIFFQTKVGRGSGVLRLTQNESGVWKAFLVHTTLQELNGAEEPLGEKRWYGTIETMPGGLDGGNWQERRERKVQFLDEEPQVVIVGAGQSGLNLGARLQSVGVSALIIDKNERVGDNWRHRYRTLVTHDPAEFTHMAYLPFPKNWPQFTPKDKLGDWFEHYASIMELNVWTKTTIKHAEYDDAKGEWTVKLQREDAEPRTLRPHHVVFATGHAGEPKVPTFPGQQEFKGLVYHGSQHRDAAEHNVKGKKVLVVGTGNSGHDIAENFCVNGADVTMIQRTGTYVLTCDKGVFMLHEGTHDEHTINTEEADIMGESLPYPVMLKLGTDLTKRIAAVEHENLEGLEKAGFKLDYGVDGGGIGRLYFTRGGGYYVDVGASKLIIEGKIKVHQSPGGIVGFSPSGMILNDGGNEGKGTELPADIVVLATGYDNMRTSLRKALGDKVADRAKDVWDLDEEGELNAMWRPSGHPGFWYMGGNLALARIYSKFLALQIKGIETGLYDQKEDSNA